MSGICRSFLLFRRLEIQYNGFMDEKIKTSATKTARLEQHKHETGRQVLLPGILILIVFLLAVAGFSYLALTYPVGMSKAANYLVAVIFFLLLILTLGFGILTVFLTKQVKNWQEALPDATDQVNLKIEAIPPVVNDILNKVTNPLIQSESKVKAFFNLFKSKS